jgi:hypothetical protein
MKSLKQFEFKSAGTQRSQYPWEQILDGGIYQCEQGEGKDFECSLVTFAALARTRAASMGKGVKIAQDSEKGTVVLQAYNLSPDEALKAKQRVKENRQKWAAGRKAKLAANGHATAPAVNSADAPAPKAANAAPAAKPQPTVAGKK